MPEQTIELIETRVGGPYPFSWGGRAIWSSIHKLPVRDDRVYLTPLGLAGDNVTNTALLPGTSTRVHGGDDRAVYAFAWRAHFPTLTAAFGSRPFMGKGVGENLRVDGATEADVRIGDWWQWGDALLEVTGPRIPGVTLPIYFDGLQVDQAMIDAGMCGWFLRVIKPGLVSTRGQIRRVRHEISRPTILQEFERRTAHRH